MTGWRLRVVTVNQFTERIIFVEYKPSLEIVFDFHTICKKNIYIYLPGLINDPFSLKRHIVIILFERWQLVEIDVYRCISGLYLNTAVLMSRIRVDLISWNNRLIIL